MEKILFLGPETPRGGILKTFTERNNLISIKTWPLRAHNILTDRESYFIILDASNREDTASEVSAEDCNNNISSLEQTQQILSCVALNVCGIKSKLIFPEFISFIKNHDIICFSESKLADTDTVEIEGYTAFYKNRDIYRRKSGGLLLLVRNCYLKHIRIYEVQFIAIKI